MNDLVVREVLSVSGREPEPRKEPEQEKRPEREFMAYLEDAMKEAGVPERYAGREFHVFQANGRSGMALVPVSVQLAVAKARFFRDLINNLDRKRAGIEILAI